MKKRNEPAPDFEADLQIGPTDQGMVRFIVTHNGGVLNMDFEPSEALEIADEIVAAANRVNG